MYCTEDFVLIQYSFKVDLGRSSSRIGVSAIYDSGDGEGVP